MVKDKKMLTLSHIELTNFCNLKCFHCPHSGGISYRGGYLTLENFKKALPYASPNGFNFALHGEALLHPQVCEFAKVAKEAGVQPFLATNGLLLTDTICEKLIKLRIGGIEVGIYSEKAFLSFKNLFAINESLGNLVSIIGDIYPCHLLNSKGWAENIGLEKKHLKSLRVSPMHNWTKDSEKHSWKECSFIDRNWCVMKWDGKIFSCCYDFDGVNYIGDIDDFPNLQHRTDYKLCEHCSPSWVHQNNDVWYDYASFYEPAK